MRTALDANWKSAKGNMPDLDVYAKIIDIAGQIKLGKDNVLRYFADTDPYGGNTFHAIDQPVERIVQMLSIKYSFEDDTVVVIEFHTQSSSGVFHVRIEYWKLANAIVLNAVEI